MHHTFISFISERKLIFIKQVIALRSRLFCTNWLLCIRRVVRILILRILIWNLSWWTWLFFQIINENFVKLSIRITVIDESLLQLLNRADKNFISWWNLSSSVDEVPNRAFFISLWTFNSVVKVNARINRFTVHLVTAMITSFILSCYIQNVDSWPSTFTCEV